MGGLRIAGGYGKFCDFPEWGRWLQASVLVCDRPAKNLPELTVGHSPTGSHPSILTHGHDAVHTVFRRTLG